MTLGFALCLARPLREDSASPDPRVCAPPRPTLRPRAPPCPTLGSALRLARPLGEDSASPDPEAVGSASPDRWVRGFRLARSLGLCSASHDPWVCAPPHPASGGGLRLVRPRGHGLRLVRRRPISPPTTPGPSVWVSVKALTSGRRPARPDVTHGHDRPYLMTHIKNSVGRTGAVLPNPHMNTDRRVSSP